MEVQKYLSPNNMLRRNEDWKKVLRTITSGAPARVIARALNEQGFYIPVHIGNEICQGCYWQYFDEYNEWAPAKRSLLLNIQNIACSKNAIKHLFEKEDIYEMLRWLKERHLI